MKIENDIAVAENISPNHGVFVPRNIQPGIPLHLIKHIDFKNDTSELHGTTLVVFLKNSKLNHELLKIRRTKCFTFQHFPFHENVMMRPNAPNEKFLTLKLQVHQLTFLRIVMLIVFGDYAKFSSDRRKTIVSVTNLE